MSGFPYQDPSIAVDDRVSDLLSRMTADDKVGLIFHSHAGLGDPESRDKYGRAATGELIRARGITAFLVQGSPRTGRELARWHNQVQRIALEHPLGIPVTISSDPRHAVTDNPLTGNESAAFSRWPEPLGIAAIGSDEIARQFGDVTRREYLAGGIRVALHPQIDLTTEPRWARQVQSFGEDSDLTSRLVRAYLAGLQNGSVVGSESVSGMAKHFPGGGPQKDGRDPHFADGREQVYPGGRFEHHLQPFIAAIAAGVSQMMPYYGMPIGTEYEEVGFAFSKGIITSLLRERLGFDGIVCTDFGVITGYGPGFPAKAWGVEHLSGDERMLKLLDAGIDQFGGESGTDALSALVRAGSVSHARLDESARRLLREKFRLGLFDDRRFVDESAADSIIGSPDHVEAGRRAQQASVTLLRNGIDRDPVLPLRKGIRVFAEGMDANAFQGLAVVAETPQDADIAIVRLAGPSSVDPALGFTGSMHMGSLEFDPAVVSRVNGISGILPTVVDTYLERPAVLTPLQSSVLTGSFGTDDRLFAEVIFGDAEPLGSLPFDLPRSMTAVQASREDVPFDTEDPLYRFGHGLRYAHE